MYIIIAALILGLSIVRASSTLATSFASRNDKNRIGTYQLIKVDEKNILVMDTRTGEYWRKPITENLASKSALKETDKYA
jgi:hypothetical protein